MLSLPLARAERSNEFPSRPLESRDKKETEKKKRKKKENKNKKTIKVDL